jgi:hypothetical protein
MTLYTYSTIILLHVQAAQDWENRSRTWYKAGSKRPKNYFSGEMVLGVLRRRDSLTRVIPDERQ